MALQLVEVAKSGGISIHAPQSGRISFFNSPYHMHFELSAVDIYPEAMFAPSPVAGKVVAIRKFVAPKPKYFQAPRHDYIIAIQPPQAEANVVRVLHVIPSVELGQKVEVGDQLGEILRSGFYDFWTDLHLHVEIRRKEDFIRARGGMPLEPRLGEVKLINEPKTNFKAKIVLHKPEYVLLQGAPLARVGNFIGLAASVGGQPGILDGGLPYYGWGAVMGNYFINDEIFLGGLKIGMGVKRSVAGITKFKTLPISVQLNDLRVFGISCYLSLNDKYLLKAVPRKLGAIDISGEVNVTLNRVPS